MEAAIPISVVVLGWLHTTIIVAGLMQFFSGHQPEIHRVHAVYAPQQDVIGSWSSARAQIAIQPRIGFMMMSLAALILPSVEMHGSPFTAITVAEMMPSWNGQILGSVQVQVRTKENVLCECLPDVIVTWWNAIPSGLQRVIPRSGFLIVCMVATIPMSVVVPGWLHTTIIVAGLMPFSSGRQPEMPLTISLFHYAQMMSVQMEHRPSKMQMNAGNLRRMGKSKALMVR